MLNKDYIRLMRRKNGCVSDDSVDENTLEARETFDNMLENRLASTVKIVPYVKKEKVGIDNVGEKIRVNIIDVSKNDQKVNDEKYVSFSWSMDVNIGDQVYWDGVWWVMYHKEHNSVETHKTFTAKQCNFEYSFERNGVKYFIPISLINLTLYSDGMADKVQMSNADGKRKVVIPDNEHTKNINIGYRLMITNDTVFEITHMDNFTRPGIKDCIISQVFTISRDDKENNLAYNKVNEKKDNSAILGSDVIYIGGKEVYTVNYDKVKENDVVRWSVISNDNCVVLDTSYNGCRIICKDDISYIGEVVRVILECRSGDIVKEIKVKGFF